MPVYVLLHDKGALQMEVRLRDCKQVDHPGLLGWAQCANMGPEKWLRKAEESQKRKAKERLQMWQGFNLLC